MNILTVSIAKINKILSLKNMSTLCSTFLLFLLPSCLFLSFFRSFSRALSRIPHPSHSLSLLSLPISCLFLVSTFLAILNENVQAISIQIDLIAQLVRSSPYKPNIFQSQVDKKIATMDQKPADQQLPEDLEIDMNFNNGFDPNKSRRHQNRSTFDGNGRYRTGGQNVCDCLIENCVGCHFPCPKCKSPKCGNECRQYRQYAYGYVFSEASKTTIFNDKSTDKK